jgi:hypothetical protein
MSRGQGKNETPIYNWGIMNGNKLLSTVFDTRARARAFLNKHPDLEQAGWEIWQITTFKGWSKG